MKQLYAFDWKFKNKGKLRGFTGIKLNTILKNFDMQKIFLGQEYII